MRRREETAPLVRNVFRRVWTEFYRNEVTYSRNCIDGLICPRPTKPLPPLNLSDSELSTSTLGNWDAWDAAELYEDIPTDTPFAPHASYESCTPAPQCIFLGDDPEVMPFIPFADDPRFDYIDNTTFYDGFAWQCNGQCMHLDSDCESCDSCIFGRFFPYSLW
jgi:hypothetical protein